ncbi:MAG: indole-3-glycerol-phosphate synthase [Phycisphaera sp.]|nr:MAG: indole-3-glycerol-phosphate synthase [Phycisphaera sp.]
MATILDEIIEFKKLEVAERMSRVPLSEVEARARQVPPTRDFVGSLLAPLGDLKAAVIAEIKRKSPSAGWIRPEYEPRESDGFAPEDIARQYHDAGARAISCLTDEKYFAGHLGYLERVRGAVSLPVLRKDFTVDVWQIFESRAHGADAVLLIAECLTDSQISEMIALSVELGMDVLLESHDRANLERSVLLGGATHPDRVLIGINNRDLRVMKVDLGHTIGLVGEVPNPRMLVSESGIGTPKDLDQLAEAGVRIALVGERLMATESPGEALRILIGP